MEPVSTRVLLLVGHGGVPKDFPREKLLELKRLEGARRGRHPPSPEERQLDHELRYWPRTSDTDPYQPGLERLREALEQQAGITVAAAYNEFCAPSVEVAIASLVTRGAQNIQVLTTMITAGGSHAQLEIPEALERCRERFPDVELNYAWPFAPKLVAAMMLAQLQEPQD